MSDFDERVNFFVKICSMESHDDFTHVFQKGRHKERCFMPLIAKVNLEVGISPVFTKKVVLT